MILVHSHLLIWCHPKKCCKASPTSHLKCIFLFLASIQYKSYLVFGVFSIVAWQTNLLYFGCFNFVWCCKQFGALIIMLKIHVLVCLIMLTLNSITWSVFIELTCQFPLKLWYSLNNFHCYFFYSSEIPVLKSKPAWK